jgi:methylaspartate mutase epsilon subunit
MIDAFSVLIGSIGDDSHSIGTNLLAISLREEGFQVKNLGILNQLKDFFHHAEGYDAVLISCINGHADLFLEDFPMTLKRFKTKVEDAKLWYLGGNLSVQLSSEEIVKKYRGMGFDFVSPKPISCDVIFDKLYRDFYHKGIKKKRVSQLNPEVALQIPFLDVIDDEPLSDEVFFKIREEVLDSWPTGKDVWDTDVLENHSSPLKNLSDVIVSQKMDGRKPLIQPRTGVAHTSDEIEILKYLRENGLDVSSIQLDAASRKNMYDKAQQGVERTEKGKSSFLNGYPVPVHGVKGVKKILKEIDNPFQVRAGSPDHRLVYEIGVAGGASSLEGGFICYLFPYDKNTPPSNSLNYWKYVDKLTGWYYKKHKIIINREYFGPLTCCLIEPVIPICINIVQAILSAKSGAKCISVGLAEQGNRIQDVASLKVLEQMTHYYFQAFGLVDCRISTVFHQYMAAFPTDMDKSRSLICESSTTATLAQASRIMTKTPVESQHIPTKEDNAEGLHLTKQGIQGAKGIEVNQEMLEKEMQLLTKEVKAIMGKIIELGKGSLAKGAIKAFEMGILDIPFSPSNFNQNRLLTARDCDGAIRFINPEKLPFDEKTQDFHREKIHQRKSKERITKISGMIEKDVTRIWKNDFIRWPLDGHYVC